MRRVTPRQRAALARRAPVVHDQGAHYVAALRAARGATTAGRLDRARLRDLVVYLVKAHGLRTVCEVGGGRAPLVEPAEVRRLGLHYVVLDPSTDQLRALDPAYDACRAPIEAAGAASWILDRAFAGVGHWRGRFDLVVSHMVLEHVRDGAAAQRGVLTLLRPGGLALHLHPTLYAAPFVLNRLLPEAMSRPLAGAVRSGRKFPAYYSGCTATAGAERRLRRLGFARAAVIPLYGHGYYRALPPLDRLQRAFAALCRRLGLRLFAAYALVIAMK